ncbi:MAG: hypothetical protein AAFQ07_02945, partial [Chloroflexota bacterium]
LYGRYVTEVKVSDAYVAWVTIPTYNTYGGGFNRLFVWNGVCTTQLTTYFPPERGSLQYDLSGHTIVWRDAIDMQWNGTDRIVVWNGATNTLTNLDSANSNWDVRTDGEHVVWRSCNYDCQLLLWDGSEIITVTPYQSSNGLRLMSFTENGFVYRYMGRFYYWDDSGSNYMAIPIPEWRSRLTSYASEDLVVLRIDDRFFSGAVAIFVWNINRQQLVRIADADDDNYLSYPQVSGEHVVWIREDWSGTPEDYTISLHHWYEGQETTLSERTTNYGPRLFALHEGHVLFLEWEGEEGSSESYEVHYWHDGETVQLTDNTVTETNLRIYVRPDVDVTITPPTDITSR